MEAVQRRLREHSCHTRGRPNPGLAEAYGGLLLTHSAHVVGRLELRAEARELEEFRALLASRDEA